MDITEYIKRYKKVRIDEAPKCEILHVKTNKNEYIVIISKFSFYKGHSYIWNILTNEYKKDWEIGANRQSLYKRRETTKLEKRKTNKDYKYTPIKEKIIEIKDLGVYKV